MNQDHDILISVRGLVAGYGDRRILRDISFDVRRGEVFVIVGGSGCGKSTLLKHMIGLYPPIAGEVWIDEQNIVAAEGEARDQLLRTFGVVYQSGALFGSMDVANNVMLPLNEFTQLPEDAKLQVALSKLELVGLDEAAHRMPSELSGGMQKRAAIARALALDPTLLFLDEPSAGLDPVTSAGLDLLITELSHYLGITFVIVTHDVPSINVIADHLIMLDSQTKSITAEGAPAELRLHSKDPAVRRFFDRQPLPPQSAIGEKSYANQNERS